MPTPNIICKDYQHDKTEPATDEQMSNFFGNEEMTAREKTIRINEVIKPMGWTLGSIGQAEHLRDDGNGCLVKTTISQTVRWIANQI